jgi:hypothetical protein
VGSISAFVLVLCIRPTAARGQYRHEKQADGSGEEGQGSMPRGSRSGLGFLGRVPTWNRPRYAQIQGKKLSIVHSREPSPDSDREGLIDPAHDDVAHGSLAHENAYSMRPWETNRSRQHLDHVQTTYEPNAR